MFPFGIDKPNSFDSSNDSITTEPTQELEPASDVVEHPKLPPGLLGWIAQFIYNSAYKPIPIVALAAAMAYMAAIFGRSYNVFNTGLNLYIALLAPTGTGKEGATSGIHRINEAVREQVPSLDCIGPNFASPQAANRYMAKNSQCVLSIVPEIGHYFQRLNAKNASANDKGMKQFQLAAYNKSGYGEILSGSVFADGTKDFPAIQRPAYSMFGESTQEEYFKAFTEASISEGTMSRILNLEYSGPRPPSNHNATTRPHPDLVNKLSEATAHSKFIEGRNEVIRVGFADDFANQFQRDYENDCDRQINNASNEITKQLYNRAHMQLLRLAALVAVGVNYIQPMITVEHLEWAKSIVDASLKTTISRFESGKVGDISPHIIQHEQLLNCLRQYLKKEWQSSYVRNYGITQDHKNQRVITYRYIKTMLHRQPAFRNAHNPKQALDNMIQEFVSSAYLIEVRDRGMEKYRGNSVGKMWLVNNVG
ncbi:hypothetical protein [Edaphobacter dinghuensis]|uniref:DUF3987 domain-containing protein n=1 Tax=Edaphobacter dinghuensis TaxID=1560005 RepID=A0A917M244_9BACT|nr:hypothetical protein [Edaphobacter dinghuensis]GGG72000.1 hypothetical protein GCM10011585_12840 [Edaphobacter dinghuensis]